MTRSFIQVAAVISVSATILTFGAGCSKNQPPLKAEAPSEPAPSTAAKKPGPAPKPTSAPVIPAEAAKVPRPF